MVGGEMSLERTKGSFSISLRAKGSLKAGTEVRPPGSPPGLVPRRAGSPAQRPRRARAPAPLLPLLLRQPEEEAALALGAEQLAPAVVGEVRDVELVLLCGRSRKLGGAQKSPGPVSWNSGSHTRVHRWMHASVHTHTRAHSLTCQQVPEVGQADLLRAIEEQGALWV